MGDLPKEGSMLSDAARALALLTDAHGGDPWHGFSTRRILDGITAEHAAIRPAGGAHSIWEIVLHMTAWAHEVTARLGGRAPQEPNEDDWPAVGEPTPERWKSACAALDDAIRALEPVVSQVPDEQWMRLLEAPRNPALGTGKTPLQTLEGLALHNAYHSGQIALLKRQLGG
jgi:uncharacterized damage-inducible protein DinB